MIGGQTLLDVRECRRTSVEAVSAVTRCIHGVVAHKQRRRRGVQKRLPIQRTSQLATKSTSPTLIKALMPGIFF
jgi:hypothetical protein